MAGLQSGHVKWKDVFVKLCALGSSRIQQNLFLVQRSKSRSQDEQGISADQGPSQSLIQRALQYTSYERLGPSMCEV